MSDYHSMFRDAEEAAGWGPNGWKTRLAEGKLPGPDTSRPDPNDPCVRAWLAAMSLLSREEE